MMNSCENYRFVEENEVLSPQLLFYPELIQKNIRTMIKIAKDPEKLWPHIKTYKTAEVLELLMKEGIRKFKCATLSELNLAVSMKPDAIFLAYPLVGPAVDRFIEIYRENPSITIYGMGDDSCTVRILGEKAEKAGIRVKLLMDVDTGQHRTGVPFDQVETLYRKWAEIPGIEMCGLHAYDGHIHQSSETEREEWTRENDTHILSIQESLEGSGTSCPVIIAGGTPTFPCHARTQGIYLSPGTCVLQDSGYAENYSDLKFTPAAAVMTRVISHPAENRITLDLGTKAVASDPQVPRAVIPGMEYLKTVVHNEEHWVVEFPKDKTDEIPKIGTILYAIPYHVCPTVVLYPDAVVVEKQHMTGRWKIAARDRNAMEPTRI